MVPVPVPVTPVRVTEVVALSIAAVVLVDPAEAKLAVAVDAVAPLGVMVTVPSVLTIVSEVVLADVGTDAAATVAVDTVAFVFMVSVLEPCPIVIVGAVVLVANPENVPVSVDCVAPLGAIVTIPSALVIVRDVVLADVGTEEAVTVAVDAVPFVVMFSVLEPSTMVIVGAVVLVAIPENVPVSVDAEAPLGVILTVPLALTMTSE